MPGANPSGRGAMHVGAALTDHFRNAALAAGGEAGPTRARPTFRSNLHRPRLALSGYLPYVHGLQGAHAGSMNQGSELSAAERGAEIKRRGGLAPFREHALASLRLKTVIKVLRDVL